MTITVRIPQLVLTEVNIEDFRKMCLTMIPKTMPKFCVGDIVTIPADQKIYPPIPVTIVGIVNNSTTTWLYSVAKIKDWDGSLMVSSALERDLTLVSKNPETEKKA
jgi:hypothetical protein